MAEYKYLKELLTTGTGTEGSLLIPRKIYPTLIDEAQKMLIPRELAAMYFGPAQIPNSSIDINRMVENTFPRVRLTGEGAEVALDAAEYNNLNVRPRKYGVAIRITREMLEDANFNLLEHNITIAGRRFAENENSLVITALDTGANTVTGGAAITIANITRAIQYLEDADKVATDFVVGFEVLQDLRNIDTFVEFQKVGNADMLQRGFLGTVYGMNVVRVSTNAGMTTTTSYVLDRKYGYVIVEKRPITVENFELPTYDLSGAVITQRIAVAALRTNAIAIITTT